ncbi:MAG: Gfo/Idh/MocA family oxidoreductase, partial [Planctomycetes bacterium]|nr:Gfo/Idh/MocA family oxidoreductase [Planctomycetota bacterium]
MSPPNPLGLGFIGCGRIAGPYAQNVVRHPDKLKIVGAYDLVPQAAREFADKFGGRAFDSLEALLACPDVEAAVNLTIHTAHAEVTRRALEAGKHVHSEKPLATNRAEAAALVELAEKKRLRLGCSPFVILGEAQQTLWKAVRDGMIGQPLEATGHIMHGRVEKRNPSADAFLGPGAGPTLDVGCYPLNVLTSIFGPVRRMRGASADILLPERTFGAGPRQGQRFKVTVPDHATGLLEFASGLPGRLSASFTVGAATLPGIEVYGTEGSLSMSNSFLFNAEVKFRGVDDKDWRPVPP